VPFPTGAKGEIEDAPLPVAAKMIALALPSPEALDISPVAQPVAPPGKVTKQFGKTVLDWKVISARLDDLGAGYHRTKLADGTFRICLTLPTAIPNQTHQVEAVAETESEAIHLALEQAEQWANQ
jgi:hypothetical protein